MSRALFVDAGAYVAFHIANDQHHKVAKACFEELNKTRRLLITSTDIVDEAVTLIEKWANADLAVEFGETLARDRRTRIADIDDAIRKAAWSRFKAFGDKSFSLTDCTTMAVMKLYRVEELFTFDQEFRKVGVKVVP